VSAGEGSDPGVWTNELKELPLSGDALQVVQAAIRELEPGPVHEFTHGRGHPDVVRRSQGHDPRGSVDSDSADISRGELDFAAVDSGANPDA
jgi:hypothetical protein